MSDMAGCCESMENLIRTSKLNIFNQNYKGIRNDTKRKETRGDTDGTIILFLDPLIFDTKIPKD